MVRRAALLAMTIAVLAACARGPGTSPATDLTVFAAASLRSALDDVAVAYEAELPGVTLTISTDSSAALATQIEQGAPADVFLSADTTNPQRLVDGGLATSDVVMYAGNVLAVIVPADNPAGIESPADLARAGVKVIAAGERVPISVYASQLVENLAAEPGYPPDFVDAYAANVVSREDNVAGVVAKIELGEGDAAIVYATDARGWSDLVTIDVPAAANVTATYGGVVVGGSEHEDAATAFLDWLTRPDGQAILADFGFQPLALMVDR
jgi:molybdate transport system substrate-binding protein